MTTATLEAPSESEIKPDELRGQVEALSRSKGEPDWLVAFRLASLEQALGMNWWTGQEESWRRTPRERLPRRARVGRVAGGSNGTPVSVPSHVFAPDAHAGMVHQIDGRVAASDLADQARAQGVIIKPLSAAAREHPGLIQEWLGSVGPPSDRYDAFGRALWTQGVFVYAPPGAVIDESLFYLITQDVEQGDHWHYTLVVAERESQLSLIDGGDADDRRAELGEAPLIHASVELIAEAGANLQFASVQRWHRQTAAISTTRGRVGRDATIRVTTAAFGADLDKQRIDMDMSQNGGYADIRGLFVGDGKQHIEHVTRQYHNGVGATSDLLIRGVLTDESQAVQYGLIRITPEGQKTNAHQTMRNLLLDDGAGADPIPMLEIEADDVKCSHAAAVGPVDPDQLFYLQARGIPPKVAERMVVRGFLAEIADGVPDEHMRDVIDELVEIQLEPTRSST
ncbi:MAG: Fe-S cluster assembly protein SufD [Chloroflexi bacterium]|nr:Fe-S cluster assembly protein SufD [Chloroflexota bacterium]MYD16854.1 Fe-S cluster assembly protein SufD [Chloroflexota bacterium]MYJ02252.1 Fe-S cluster assembly protein SufD [Chloroflexota bacterium]